jgi:DNA-binding LacI/PurR family transcriptional regulator
MEVKEKFAQTRRHGDIRTIAENSGLSAQTVHRWMKGERLKRQTELRIIDAIENLKP